MLAIASSRKPRIVQSPVQPAMLWTKLRRSRAPCGRVHDLGVELRAVEAARLVGDRRRRARSRTRRCAEAGRQRGDPVAVAHPHRIALAHLPDAVEQRRRARRARPRRGRIRGRGRPRPCRRAAAPWSARRSRCRAPARRLKIAGGARGAPRPSTEAGPPERITAFGGRPRERLVPPSGTGGSRNRRRPRARAARSAA